MPALEFPIEALMVAVVAALSADAASVGADAVDHYLGERETAALLAPPRYVWIPTRTREQNQTKSRTVNDPRSLFSTQEYVQVHCWGETFAQAFAMRNNLLRAVQHQIPMGVRIENADWMRPGTAWNQSGELYVVEFSFGVPVFDAYTDPFTGEYAAENTVDVDVVEGELSLVDDVAVAGTTSATTTTA